MYDISSGSAYKDIKAEKVHNEGGHFKVPPTKQALFPIEQQLPFPSTTSRLRVACHQDVSRMLYLQILLHCTMRIDA